MVIVVLDLVFLKDIYMSVMQISVLSCKCKWLHHITSPFTLAQFSYPA